MQTDAGQFEDIYVPDTFQVRKGRKSKPIGSARIEREIKENRTHI